MNALRRGWVLALVCAGGALAQDPRPSEADLFGGAPAEADAGVDAGALPPADAGIPAAERINPHPGPGPAPTPNAASTEGSRDVQELGSSNIGRDAFATGEAVENPLTIGGLFYQRGFASFNYTDSHNVAPINQTTYSLPLQVNGFLDARPNDRIRAFVLARLQYDPTLDPCSAPTTAPFQIDPKTGAPYIPICPRASPTLNGIAGGNGQFNSTSGAPTSFGTGTQTPSNPAVALDQAWLKFDIARVLFVTVGKQHVKWGASRFWNPTDFLHTQKRDPLLPYDLRLGNNMVKVALPFEEQQANLYAVGLFDNPQPASTLGQLGGALRAEKVFGDYEVGAEVVFRNQAHPVMGADISGPVGPFDVYAEAAYREHTDIPLYQIDTSTLPSGVDPNALLHGGALPFPPQNVPPGLNLASLFPTANPVGRFLQVSGGLTYSFGYMENRLATVGAEYFYNGLGYDNRFFYPWLIFNGIYQPFYTGKHYAALYATAEGPDQYKHTSFTLSNIGNLSDLSFISRLDFSWRVLTYLTFEAYADVHYGNEGGEFRFGLDTRNAVPLLPPFFVPTPLFDAGFGLRVSI